MGGEAPPYALPHEPALSSVAFHRRFPSATANHVSCFVVTCSGSEPIPSGWIVPRYWLRRIFDCELVRQVTPIIPRLIAFTSNFSETNFRASFQVGLRDFNLLLPPASVSRRIGSVLFKPHLVHSLLSVRYIDVSGVALSCSRYEQPIFFKSRLHCSAMIILNYSKNNMSF